MGKSRGCPLGLKIGEGVKCEWVAHGKLISDDVTVIMADINQHHAYYAVLVEVERD